MPVQCDLLVGMTPVVRSVRPSTPDAHSGWIWRGLRKTHHNMDRGTTFPP
jgi:hypothetical protein